MIGFGVISLLDSDSSVMRAECMQILLAIGLGILYVTPQFLILGTLDVDDHATALALMHWFQAFGQCVTFTSWKDPVCLPPTIQ